MPRRYKRRKVTRKRRVSRKRRPVRRAPRRLGIFNPNIVDGVQEVPTNFQDTLPRRYMLQPPPMVKRPTREPRFLVDDYGGGHKQLRSNPNYIFTEEDLNADRKLEKRLRKKNPLAKESWFNTAVYDTSNIFTASDGKKYRLDPEIEDDTERDWWWDFKAALGSVPDAKSTKFLGDIAKSEAKAFGKAAAYKNKIRNNPDYNDEQREQLMQDWGARQQEDNPTYMDTALDWGQTGWGYGQQGYDWGKEKYNSATRNLRSNPFEHLKLHSRDPSHRWSKDVAAEDENWDFGDDEKPKSKAEDFYYMVPRSWRDKYENNTFFPKANWAPNVNKFGGNYDSFSVDTPIRSASGKKNYDLTNRFFPESGQSATNTPMKSYKGEKKQINYYNDEYWADENNFQSPKKTEKYLQRDEDDYNFNDFDLGFDDVQKIPYSPSNPTTQTTSTMWS